MSYVAQGATLDTIAPAIFAAAKIVEDPAVPEIACEVIRLNKVMAGQNPGPPCQRRVLTPADKRKGVGLYVARQPLRAYVWARQHPGTTLAIGAGIVLAIGLVGYTIGKKSR
jgi:hypothetical protein